MAIAARSMANKVTSYWLKLARMFSDEGYEHAIVWSYGPICCCLWATDAVHLAQGIEARRVETDIGLDARKRTGSAGRTMKLWTHL